MAITEAQHSETYELFGDSLEELIRAVLKASGRGVPGGETELTLSQYFVMDAMADEALTALETRGFVDRERNEEEDRRLVTVALTRSGRAVLDEKRTWVKDRQREIFDGLSDAEQGTVIGALSAIAHNIEEL